MAENSNITCIVLAAGNGTRMKSKTHKMMHKVGGMPLLGHVLNMCQNKLKSKNTAVIADPNEQPTLDYIKSYNTAEIAFQNQKLGTAHAVLMAKKTIINVAKNAPNSAVLVLYADIPFISVETLNSLAEQINKGQDIVVLGFEPKDPAQYGRLLTDKNNQLLAIREFKDATQKERDVGLCNAGLMAFKAKHMLKMLEKIDNKNASKEYYLTDCVEIAKSLNLKIGVTTCTEVETHGINDRVQLAQAETIFQNTLRETAMRNGVTLIDPLSVYLSANTVLEPDVIIEPNVVINGYVTIKSGTIIRAFSHIEGSRTYPTAIAKNSNIGPYARLREGSQVGQDCKIGNFVETKKTTVENGAKINHLSYVGDAHVGENANIGAGTITCNYDGYKKHKTIIGKGAFIGSNTSLIAPVTIEDGGYVGSGSVITKNVTADALAISRAKQTEIKGWAKKFKTKNKG